MDLTNGQGRRLRMIKRNIYKPNKPNKPMTKQKELILQVRENKTGQKRVTIPRESEIEHEDYVEVKKHE